MNICKHCKKLVSVNMPTHYRLCVEYNSFINKCKYILTKEYLIEHYVNGGESMMFIAKLLGLEKTRLVISKLKEYDIPIQSSPSDYCKKSSRQQLCKETSKEKYGVEHHLMHKDIIQKRVNTVTDMYGCSNVFQSDKIKNKSIITNLERYGVANASSSKIVRDKIKVTSLERYGSECVFGNREIIEKSLKTKAANGNKMGFHSKSSQEYFWKIYNKLPKELQEHTYFHELNKEFGLYGVGRYMSYDFVITNIKYCLEYNGHYYHADPNIYEASYLNKKMNMTAQEIWDKDKEKHDYIKSKGYILNVVWENPSSTKIPLSQNIDINKIISNIMNQTHINNLNTFD
jgi:hypothetical protein